ncbi:MAG: hypothetical protein NC452_04030 [Eubacterium sp.]|nr:hypothetical protein [Eubacterium sp.]
MVKYEKPKVFEVKATRCQRCGGILLSEFGLKNGMGHVCKRKADEETAAAKVDDNQLTFFEQEERQDK